ncbi:unnamed protein product [Paramecium sonneborni]|uniref:Kinesin motor domain-containing protein n=1 Tax=Paramecium sonneborni TaxID=65129 RepID=A0A8S1RLY5_9CILI|nr:unnamed protein product [Paramecium sonneborni]
MELHVHYLQHDQERLIQFLVMREIKGLHSNVQIIQLKKQIEVSIIVIYNETIRDLLNTNQKSLVIMYNSQKGQYISGVQHMVYRNGEEVRDVLNLGNQNRSLAQTIYNVSSSRSHAVIQMNLSYKIENQILTYRNSKLTRLLQDSLGGITKTIMIALII